MTGIVPRGLPPIQWRVLAGDGAPTIDWLAAIAVALDVDAGELLAPVVSARSVPMAAEPASKYRAGGRSGRRR